MASEDDQPSTTVSPTARRAAIGAGVLMATVCEALLVAMGGKN